MGDILSYISIAGSIAAIIFGVCALVRNSKKDAKENGETLAALNFIADQVKQINDMQREHAKEYKDMLERMNRCEASVKTAHKRIDTEDIRIHEIEKMLMEET